MRRRLLAFLAVLLLFLVIDARRAPADQFITRAAIGGIHVYQATLSRVYARAGLQCRFSPTCSHYAEACIRHLGLARGGWLAAKRLVKCGPWTPAGTLDPPPV